MSIEDPYADVVEQQRPLDEGEDVLQDPPDLPIEADPADVAEQHHVVPEEEDGDRTER
jgi:hypothetical protein